MDAHNGCWYHNWPHDHITNCREIKMPRIKTKSEKKREKGGNKTRIKTIMPTTLLIIKARMTITRHNFKHTDRYKMKSTREYTRTPTKKTKRQRVRPKQSLTASFVHLNMQLFYCDKVSTQTKGNLINALYYRPQRT